MEIVEWNAVVEIPANEHVENVYLALEESLRDFDSEISALTRSFYPDPLLEEKNLLSKSLEEMKIAHTNLANNTRNFKDKVRDEIIELLDSGTISSDTAGEILENLGLDPLVEQKRMEVLVAITIEVEGTNIEWDSLGDPDIEISESDISFCSSDAEVMSVEYTAVERTDVIE